MDDAIREALGMYASEWEYGLLGKTKSTVHAEVTYLKDGLTETAEKIGEELDSRDDNDVIQKAELKGEPDDVRCKGDSESEHVPGASKYVFSDTGESESGIFESSGESGLTGVQDGQPGAEDDQEESREVLRKTEVTEPIEDPVVEGLQETLELSVKQECSAGDDDEEELVDRRKSGSHGGFAGEDAKCFGRHGQRRRFDCGRAEGAGRIDEFEDAAGGAAGGAAGWKNRGERFLDGSQDTPKEDFATIKGSWTCHNRHFFS